MSGRSRSFAKWVFPAAVVGALGFTVPAFALPMFTLSPSSLGGGAASVPNFTADDLTLSDYSTITFTPTSASSSSFTESGTLDVVQAQLANANVNTPLNTQYGFYFSFTASGTQTNFSPTVSSGSYNMLNFNLYGFTQPPSGNVTFQANNTTPSGVVSPILLATGALQGGTVTLVNGIPSASANVFFTVVDPAFFVAPIPFYNVALSAFTNTSSEVSQTGNTITITAGGGTANFTTVPEPVSLVVLGTGLIITGAARRRRTSP